MRRKQSSVNERLIIDCGIHHHYFFHEMDQDDLLEAQVMILQAVHKYDENHAVSFTGILPEIAESSSGVSA